MNDLKSAAKKSREIHDRKLRPFPEAEEENSSPLLIRILLMYHTLLLRELEQGAKCCLEVEAGRG